ncbi:DUF2796 domain-containing protein [Henriciella barbarensis]|uniref:DUF2796 domain-containing protein n=1 Tax=Henriciella barbarensis TaxID=86342 RepID=A0A399QXN3_9PROT|nr:DUF2796 domain-containing protein [Henriciella barbarensis]RIJ23886.1 DUF2796 domain-containing protein [Henriciella barbarensis]
MKYCSASFVVLASAAMLAACGVEAGSDASEPQETTETEINVEEETTEIDMVDGETDEMVIETEDHAHVERASAEGDHNDHDRDQSADEPAVRLGSHQHGYAMLAVTVQNSTISISFDAPLASVGAPESPQTDEDQAKIEAVQETLRDETNIVNLVGDVGCDLVSRSMSTRLANGHGELQASADYDCADVGALKAIRVVAFNAYPTLSEVETVYVSDVTQTSAELTRSNPELRIN